MDTRQRVVAGRYHLISPLGSGAMGTVWRAEDQLLGREVAVKEVTFPAGLSDDERQVLRERTRREARAAARLEHPSAVTVYDVVEDGDAPFLVMELVDAPTLADVVRRDGPLTPQRTAQIGLDLLGALQAAHAQGIVHRDVKPSNVLVRDDGRVVLTDFGIATATGDSSITHTGLLLGSPAYIAPERAKGEQPAPASDLWSLGATMFTAVEGKPPYDAGAAMLTVTAVVTGEHAPFSAAGPLEPVLEGLLEKDPDARLDASAARRLLTPIAEQPPARATRVLPAPPVDPIPRRAERTAAVPPLRPQERDQDRRDRPGWLVPALVALAVGIAAVGVLLASSGDEPRTSVAAPEASTQPSPSPPAAVEPAQPDEPAAPAQEPVEEPAEPAAPAQAALPGGWTTDTGGPGWTVALPPGYEQTREGEYVQASTGRTLRVDSGPGQPDAVADREAQAQDFERRHPSYQEIRIDPVDYRGYEAADWEFTYEGLHVLNRVFVVDGRGYSLFLQTPRRDAEGMAQDFEGIARHFSPA